MPEEKMDEETLQRVRERVQGRPLESWYSIYRTIFPGEDLPPSPLAEYVVGDDLRSCFEMLAQALPTLLIREAVRNGGIAGNVPPTRHTLFPTSADVILQALRHCQRQFGQVTGLSHIFRTEPPSLGESIRSTPAIPSQSSSPTHSRHSRGVSEADEHEAQIQALLMQQRYVNVAPSTQPLHPNMPYTSAGYYPPTTAPTDEDLYGEFDLPDDMYEE